MPIPKPKCPARRGFTLIELMIAIAIVGLLVGIALPNYRDSVRKSIRGEAMAHLQALAARQQQYMIDTRAFATTLAALNLSAPERVSSGYSLTLAADNAATPPTFTVTATPSTDQSKDACGTLTINQAGAKTATKSGSPVARCW